jgi:hypothetical protein
MHRTFARARPARVEAQDGVIDIWPVMVAGMRRAPTREKRLTLYMTIGI